MRLLTCLFIVLAVSACTTVPEQIQGDYPDIVPARAEPGVIGANVRWGGVILNSRNRGNRTCYEILSRELDKYLRPTQEDYTNGRFIACKDGFQDPLVFQKGREVTVTGTILHALLIEGTMEVVSKSLLAACLGAATLKALLDLKIWKPKRA